VTLVRGLPRIRRYRETKCKSNPMPSLWPGSGPWRRISMPFAARTFVLGFGGEVAAQGKFPMLTPRHQPAAQRGASAGAGARFQAADRCEVEGAQGARTLQGRRAHHRPGRARMRKEAVGALRVEIEALLSQGLPNSPMAGGGQSIPPRANFITAQPYGVHGGVDFPVHGAVAQGRHGGDQCVPGSGKHRHHFPTSAIRPPGKYSTFRSKTWPWRRARALAADKLIFLTDEPVMDDNGQLITELSAQEAERLLGRSRQLSADTRLYLQHAMEAVRGGVSRAHLVSHKVDGALLMELFTREGSGSMLTATSWRSSRPGPRSTTPEASCSSSSP